MKHGKHGGKKMIFVVDKESGRIHERFEAWAIDAEKTARANIREHGLVLLDVEITMMGDMVMWVF